MRKCWITGIASAALLLGIMATSGNAEDAVRREILGKTFLPGGQYVALQAMAYANANGVLPRHIHPGIESSYVLEGEADLLVEGQPVRHLKAGDSYQIPAGVPHSLRNGPAPTRIIVTFLLDNDKQISSPAPE
jgi:quercetin dioxygenase-like cupin family protein